MNNNEKEIVYDMLNSVGFYGFIPTKGLKSARMQVVVKALPKAVQKIQNRLLPAIEKVEESSEEISDMDWKVKE